MAAEVCPDAQYGRVARGGRWPCAFRARSSTRCRETRGRELEKPPRPLIFPRCFTGVLRVPVRLAPPRSTGRRAPHGRQQDPRANRPVRLQLQHAGARPCVRQAEDPRRHRRRVLRLCRTQRSALHARPRPAAARTPLAGRVPRARSGRNHPRPARRRRRDGIARGGVHEIVVQANNRRPSSVLASSRMLFVFQSASHHKRVPPVSTQDGANGRWETTPQGPRRVRGSTASHSNQDLLSPSPRIWTWLGFPSDSEARTSTDRDIEQTLGLRRERQVHLLSGRVVEVGDYAFRLRFRNYLRDRTGSVSRDYISAHDIDTRSRQD